MLLNWPVAALAYEGELLLFPELSSAHQSNAPPGEQTTTNEFQLDTFYTASHERLRFLAEFVLSREERDMERMQVGWVATPSSTIWLGRFHSPIGYWNMEFHHGSYLTTAIERPSLIQFEDDGGVLPVHISGLLLENASDSPISYSVGVGLGPNLSADGLTAVNILAPKKENARLAIAAKVAYQPNADNTDEFNVFTARTRIPAQDLAINGLTQTVIGTAFNRETDKLRLIGELYVINSRIDAPAARIGSHTFTSAYIQADYAAQPRWTLYARLEDSAHVVNDPYLNILPSFNKGRVLSGVRYGLAHNQAIKFELSRTRRLDRLDYSEAALQWSAVFP
ncbi:MAG: hypothetical protein V4443_11330 [Pseudomonadota bacterium]